MEVEVDRKAGAIHVKRVACAHDCGMMVNPDAVRAQVEGCILQTLSRTLHEEVAFSRCGVTSLDWRSYLILSFSKSRILIDLVKNKYSALQEPAASAVPAALANAVFDASGVRLRTLPFTAVRVGAAFP